MKPQDDIQHKFLYELGEGSYGIVYLAEDCINGGRLAIKIPKPSDMIDLSLLESSLWEEMEKLIQLCPYQNPHPNIVHPRGVKRFRGEDGSDLLGIITEFVPGRFYAETGKIKGCDLEAYLAGSPRRNEPIDLTKLVRAVQQICAALSHAHKQNVFHRDIKPNNILVRMPDETIKLADWGVAKNIDLEGLWEGSVVGTRPYMAMEVLVRMDLYRPASRKESHVIDHRADLFSLGVTLFKIIVGRHPFRTPQEIGDPEHRYAQQQALAELIGSNLAKVVMRVLEHDADDRYQSADEFSRAMTNASKLQTKLSDAKAPSASNPDLEAEMTERLEEVEQTVRRGNPDGSAEQKFRALISQYPESPKPYLQYARFCAACRTKEDVIRILSQGVQNVPQDADLRYQRARVFREAGKVPEAIEDLEMSLRLGLASEKSASASRLLEKLKSLDKSDFEA